MISSICSRASSQRQHYILQVICDTIVPSADLNEVVSNFGEYVTKLESPRSPPSLPEAYGYPVKLVFIIPMRAQSSCMTSPMEAPMMTCPTTATPQTTSVSLIHPI